MTRPIKKLSNMEIDEISTVDKGANQHAMVVIAKRAPEEELMPELYNEEGQLLNEDALNFGDIVYDAEGNAYELVEEEAEVESKADEKELATVGKSAFLEEKPETSSFSKSVLEELSKAFSDEDRDAVIAKALGRVEELEKGLQQSAEIAKAERDLRLTREYIAKAADYNLPVDPKELGPVLYRMAETMSYDDCAVIAKCLETAGSILFEERGYQGGGDNNDVLSQVELHAQELIGKSADLSAADAVNKVFDMNPDAYDAYLSAQRGQF
jgi:hypothetical protein